MTEQSIDYDSPWKEVIELYFPDFMEFFFPLAYAEIDWTRPYEFLDTELQLFRFIDWIMVLPQELTSSFKTVVRSYEETNRMRYVTSIERLAKEEGIEEGILQNSRESLIEVLETRFGEVPSAIVEAINGIDEPSVLKTLLKRAIAIPSFAEFQQLLENIGSQT